MGGICGLIHFEGEGVSPKALDALTKPAAEEAPAASLIVGEAGLSRLPAAGSLRGERPVASADGAVAVADARLDNREELRGRLAAGASPTDAELILAAYLRWGRGCAEHLVGDFAFAVWDRRRRRLFCARDPLGLKSLHYARRGPLVCFATEARQILRHPAVATRLDELSLGLYLCGEASPERTMFDGVDQLPAAHDLVATERSVETRRYWNADFEGLPAPRRAADAAGFRTLLSRAVRDRLPPPGEPVGVAMSGGLDSTSVAALAREAMGQNGGAAGLIAGSFVFDRLADCDERPYIRAMAAELGLEVETIEAERFWLLGDREVYSPALETPFMGWDGPFRELFRRLGERGVRVVLTGHGGDDLLGSSLIAERLPWRAGTLAVRNARRRGSPLLPSIYRHLVSPLAPDWLDARLRGMAGRGSGEPEVPAWIDPDFARRVDLRRRLCALAPPRRRMLRRPRSSAGLARLVRHPAVAWLDRLAAPFGIEVRHPFLDRRLIDFVLSVPVEQMIDAEWHKPLLRRAMAGLLPEAVRTRREKSLVSSFFDFSLRQKEASNVERLLRDPEIARWGFADRARLQQAFAKLCTDESQEADRVIWQAITLELWLRRHGGRFEAGAIRRPERSRTAA